MAKLYWRVKVGGVWTYKAAHELGKTGDGFTVVIPYQKEEKE